MTTTARAISIVIPTHQRCASVQRALQALARQTSALSSFEVVVSIDGSDDGTSEMVKKLQLPYRTRAISQPKLGRAAACNQGIRAATGEILVLLDDDMEPAPRFVEAHAAMHENDSHLGVLGAVPVVVDGASPPVARYIASRFAVHLRKLARADHQITLRDFYTGNFSIRRDTLLAAGLFDESFRSYGNEDVELAIRLRAAGVRLAYSPDALAHQHYEKDFAALARDKMAQGRTSVACAERHPEAIPSLRIGTYRRAGRKWRLLRSALLAATRWLRFLPSLIVRYVNWLERRRVPYLSSRYELALDYFYWLGVVNAVRDNPGIAAEVIL